VVDSIEYVNPPGLLDAGAYGFSHASVARRGHVVHLAGQTAADERGAYEPGDDLGTQARKALRNISTALRGVGATTAHLVSLRVYVVDLDLGMFPAVSVEIASFLDGGEPPPATWIGVTSLLSPEALIEIEAVAVLDDG
jgi:enamine deaminase RidA (YjgF/YER057c/UK114 family)